MLIFLEGIDGSGKTSVAAFLKNKYPTYFFRRFPEGLIRETLDTIKKKSDEASLFLFMADQILGDQEIHEYLKNNKDGVAICDRSWISTLVYQGIILGENSDLYGMVEHFMLPNIYLRPDLIIFYDVDPEEGIKRCISRAGAGTVIKRNVEFLTKIRKRYLDIFATSSSTNWIKKEILDSTNNSLEYLQNKTAILIEQLMKDKEL